MSTLSTLAACAGRRPAGFPTQIWFSEHGFRYAKYAKVVEATRLEPVWIEKAKSNAARWFGRKASRRGWPGLFET